MRKLFLGPNGLRAGWRFVGFFVPAWLLAQGLDWLVTHPLGYKYSEGWVPSDFIVDGASSFAVALVVAWLIGPATRKGVKGCQVQVRSQESNGLGASSRRPGRYVKQACGRT